jgi:hypothetical protein
MEKTAPACEFRGGRQRKPGHDIQAERIAQAKTVGTSPVAAVQADTSSLGGKADSLFQFICRPTLACLGSQTQSDVRG